NMPRTHRNNNIFFIYNLFLNIPVCLKADSRHYERIRLTLFHTILLHSASNFIYRTNTQTIITCQQNMSPNRFTHLERAMNFALSEFYFIFAKENCKLPATCRSAITMRHGLTVTA
ncbi:MAG: hypothetical protein K2H14_09475, partial [Muribaculaceae bacterium]|nr:hypothetical protein [Muribaculaceae bacterium]